MNETLTTIHNLRSIHGNFSGREISDQDLQTILQAAVHAATASAQQSYAIIVVDEKATMKEYLDYVGSKALIFCVDYNRLHETAAYIGCDYNSGDIESLVTGSTDTILAAQTAAIAAKSLGIDSLFTNSVHRHDLAKFYERFNLPEKHCFPLITLVLGYPDAEPEHQKGRLRGPGVIHYGAYQKLAGCDIEEIIKNYADPEQHLSWSPENMGKAHLEWFFNVWCKGFEPVEPVKTEEKKVHHFYPVLARAGFIDPKLIGSLKDK